MSSSAVKDNGKPLTSAASLNGGSNGYGPPPGTTGLVGEGAWAELWVFSSFIFWSLLFDL
jgi:hypothetical protein